MKGSQLTKLRKKSERMVQIMGKLERWKKLTGLVCMAVVLAFVLIIGNTSYAAGKGSINITDITMSKGQTKKLKISGTKEKVKWKSSKPSVVKVNVSGKIKAVKKGTAVITGTVSGKQYRCTVRVNQSRKNKDNILIVYFSQTGTTKDVAQKIQKLTGGDLLRIREKSKYPDDYDKTVSRAKKELNKNARPKITSVAANMKDYDVVFIGYPIWWHSTPKVIDTFLESYNLEGKTVIPFCTSGGSDIEESMPVINKLCKGSTILDGYTADSGSTKEIRRWLKRIGVIK